MEVVYGGDINFGFYRSTDGSSIKERDADAPEAEQRDIIIKTSRFLNNAVLDSSKFTIISFELFADVSKICCITTGKSMERPSQREYFSQIGVQFIIADR